jgi:hypothetical protein
VSAAKKGTENDFQLKGSWAGAWKVFAVIGLLGIVGAAVGYTQDPRRFAFSWLYSFIVVLTIALGAIFFVLIQRLTSAGWSVTVRRTAEFYGYGVVVLLFLFLPVLASMDQLFPWLHPHAGPGETPHTGALQIVTPAYAAQHEPPAAGHGNEAHGAGDPAGHLPGSKAGVPGGSPAAAAAHGDAPAHMPSAGHHGSKGDPHQIIHAEVMQKKAPYLNRNFFLVRVAIYFFVWIFIGTRLFSYSVQQDATRAPSLTLAAQRFAPPATFVYALTLTGAAVDWIMSLEPSWFSTIFGVVIFACGVVASLAVIILTAAALRSSGLEGSVTVEHYHDLGKLMFGFLVFWGYVNFSQYMLIWYAALPEETTFFHNRWDYAPWQNVSYAIILFHFVVPFFWTMSRWFKRNTGRLQIGALILLVMHVVDMYWFVMPNYHLGKEGFTFHWLDAACLLANVGVYGAFVFRKMTTTALVPVGDPRLERSLQFLNA